MTCSPRHDCGCGNLSNANIKAVIEGLLTTALDEKEFDALELKNSIYQNLLRIGDVQDKLNDFKADMAVNLSALLTKTELASIKSELENLIKQQQNIYEDLQRAFEATTNQKLLDYKSDIVDIQREVSKELNTVQNQMAALVPTRDAYKIAVQNGYVGSEASWLDSLKGQSAYTIAKAHGFKGSEAEWLSSLKGDRGPIGEKGNPGNDGISAYEVAKKNGFVGSESAWLNSLIGEKGERGVGLAHVSHNSDNTLTFLFTDNTSYTTKSLKGEQGIQGIQGITPYEQAVKEGFKGTVKEWLTSLKPTEGTLQALTKFMNNDAETEVTVPELGNIPSLQGHIKQMFENGGLPATPFQTYTGMTSSNLADGSYAVIVNDSVNRGLYHKSGGKWVKQFFDFGDLKDKSGEFSQKLTNLLASRVSSTETPPTIDSPINPASFFGDRLISYFDYTSVPLVENGQVATTTASYLLGNGNHPIISFPAKANLGQFNPLTPNLDQKIFHLKALNGTQLVVNYSEKAAIELSENKSFTFWLAGVPTILSSSVYDILFQLGDVRFTTGYILGAAYKSNYVGLQKLANGTWENIKIWEVSINEFQDLLVEGQERPIKTTNPITLAGPSGYKRGSLVLEVSDNLEESSLYVNFEKREPHYIGPHHVLSESTNLTQSLGRYHDTNSGYITNVISSGFLIDTPAESCKIIADYLSKETHKAIGYYLDSEGLPNQLRNRIYTTTAPIPTTLFGGYSVIKAAGVPNDFDIADTITEGSVAQVRLPPAPNVAPWTAPHDRFMIDGSVLRLNVLPHPEYPDNPQKLVMMANGVAYPTSNSSNYLITMCAYESSDGGASFTRKAVDKAGMELPSWTTSTVNNIVVPKAYGRYFYCGDVFTDGYKPETSSRAYKYFYLDEWDQVLYGCGDLFDFSTYDKIKMNRQSIYDPKNPTKISNQWRSHFEGQEANPIGLEEKIIDYDPTTGRFFRISKIQTPALDSVHSGTSNKHTYMSRHLAISWSEKNDITRWGPYEMFIPGRRKYYQSYDLDIMKYSADTWLVFVHRYSVRDASHANTETKYKDQHEKMTIDLYVSHDQFKSPPVLIKEDWISNNDQAWASGTLWAYKHPYKHKVYVSGGTGLHGGLRPNDDYYDYANKVALVDIPNLGSTIKPDSRLVTGKVVSRLMDGSRVDKFRIIASGYFRARITDANGVPIPNMDFDDFMLLDNKSGLAHWNGIFKPPSQMIKIEVIGVNYGFSGIYPMQETSYKLR